MIDLQTIARGASSRIAEPRQIVARDLSEWTALWAAHAGPDGSVPPVDLATRIVVGAFAGEKPTAGHSIQIVEAVAEPGAIRLIVDSRAPEAGMVSAQILTSPFHIVSVPRTAGEIRWSAPGEPRPHSPGPPRGHSRRTRVPSSTGLRPRTASALAYLAGPFSGAIILLAESANETVRFHAWQSILGVGALVLIVAGAFASAAGSLFVSASTVPVMVRLATILTIVLVIVWAICLGSALAGRRWKLPLAGAWAERLAATSPRARAER